MSKPLQVFRSISEHHKASGDRTSPQSFLSLFQLLKQAKVPRDLGCHVDSNRLIATPVDSIEEIHFKVLLSQT